MIWKLSSHVNRAACLDCLDWIPNRDAYIDAWLSGDGTRKFSALRYKALRFEKT